MAFGVSRLSGVLVLVVPLVHVYEGGVLGTGQMHGMAWSDLFHASGDGGD